MDSSSFSSAGNPPFLLSKQLNRWWNKWTKHLSELKSEGSTISSMSLDPLDWSGKLPYPPKNLDMNGQELYFWNIWSLKNNNLMKTLAWMSWTMNNKHKTPRKRPVPLLHPKIVFSVHSSVLKPQNYMLVISNLEATQRN